MGCPELNYDEPVLLESQNIKFKSISFDAILTNKRIILINSKKNTIPAQEIALSTIRNFEAGENTIRDYFLILSLVTETGEKHQEVLTFSRQAGFERKREWNEWAKKLKSLVPPSTPVVAPSIVPDLSREPLTKRDSPIPQQGTFESTRPAKKKIDIVRPRATSYEKSADFPEPTQTISLPAGSICTRCGNRVALKSTFCTHCGLANKQSSEPRKKLQPVEKEEPVSVPVLTPDPVETQKQEMVQAPAESREKCQTHSIEQTISAIELPIQDAVLSALQCPDPSQKPASRQHSEPGLTLSSKKIIWAVIPRADPPLTAPCETDPAEQKSLPALPSYGSAGRKTRYITAGILMIAIIPTIIGLVIVATGMSGLSGGIVTLPPVPDIVTTILKPATSTTAAIETLSPGPGQLMIPLSGIWVRASYPGTYTGLIETSGNQTVISGTGDKFYPVSLNDGSLWASIRKNDENEDEISLEIYKNGVMIKRESNITPKGIVEIQLDLKTL